MPIKYFMLINLLVNNRKMIGLNLNCFKLREFHLKLLFYHNLNII